jgi:DNA-directed RNA polymerase specialized sigma24 family protein
MVGIENRKTGAAANTEGIKKDAADLYWLALLLTGRSEISIDIATDTVASATESNPFFESWMGAWSRKIVISKALAAIREELAESARRTARERVDCIAARNSRVPEMSKAGVEEALLAIDAFPRAAVLLSIFEGIGTADAAILLDSDRSLVEKGRAIGLRELTANLAERDGAISGFAPLLLGAVN